jgi:hypothetical protein
MAKENSQGFGGFGAMPIALFLVLVIAGSSILVVAFQEAPKGTPSYTVVDGNGILEALLSTTVDYTTYTDSSGTVHVYTGWTVQELMIEDLELRSSTTTKANVSSLAGGIEDAINKKLHDLSGEHHYDLKASFGAAFFRAKDLDLQGQAKATINVHMRSFDSDAKIALWMTE